MGKRLFKAALCAALLADCAMTAVLLAKTLVSPEEVRLDAAVEREMAAMTYAKYEKESADAESDEEEESPIDKGFENIMRFTVNGNTGFEVK